MLRELLINPPPPWPPAQGTSASILERKLEREEDGGWVGLSLGLMVETGERAWGGLKLVAFESGKMLSTLTLTVGPVIFPYCSDWVWPTLSSGPT